VVPSFVLGQHPAVALAGIGQRPISQPPDLRLVLPLDAVEDVTVEGSIGQGAQFGAAESILSDTLFLR
jgi:hypothetical protein